MKTFADPRWVGEAFAVLCAHWNDPSTTAARAAEHLNVFLQTMGQSIGPPWQAKHKLAEAAALAATWTRQIAR